MATQDQARYMRCRLVLGEVLTQIMREYMEQSGTQPTSIERLILGNPKFKNRLNQKEMCVIQTLPSHGFKKFDISLMYKIARSKSFSLLISDKPTRGWGANPQQNEYTAGDNIERIRLCRDDISHMADTSISEHDFLRLFSRYIDIAQRAEAHLQTQSFKQKILQYQTCNLDHELENKFTQMEEEYKQQIRDLKKLLQTQVKPDLPLTVYIDQSTQTVIEELRAKSPTEGTIKSTITFTGIENAQEKADLLNSRGTNLSTESVEFKYAEKGSLVLYVEISIALLQDDRLLNREMESFIQRVFAVADLQCFPKKQCDVFFSILEENLDSSSDEDSSSLDEPCSSRTNLVLNVEIRKEAFATEQSLSHSVHNFLGKAISGINGQPVAQKQEMTAVIAVQESDTDKILKRYSKREIYKHSHGAKEINVKEESGCDISGSQHNTYETITNIKQSQVCIRRPSSSSIEKGRKNWRLLFGFRRLTELKDKESNEILLHCTSNKDSLKDALNETDHDEEMFSLILRCCAKACLCESLSQKLFEFLIILEDSKFLKATLTDYMIRIQNLPSTGIELHEDRLVDIMMIFTQLKMRVPHAMLLSLGVLAMLEGVLQTVENECGSVSHKLAATFKAWKETKQIVVKQKGSKQNERYMSIAEDEWLPPENFRDIPVLPEPVDINVQNMPFLRRNKDEGRYHDLNHYLDVQFRLLREDFIAPLREGVKEYIEAVSTYGKTTRLQDVRIYTDVQIISPICSNLGLCQRVTFSCPGFNRIRWESSKRLIFGSLVVLSADKFETFLFATVANRDLKNVRKGLVDLQFECDSQRLTSVPPGTNFVMAETSAYFEAYRHVLLGLQNMKEGDLPFEKYIVHCEVNVQPPAYLCRQPSARLDLRPLVDEDMWLRDESHQPGRRVQDASKPLYTFSARANMANNIKVTDERYWPDPELLHLDNSQFDAVRTALSKEFVIIQGPPGTGKTYIGLKIVRALLHNKSLWTTDPITREHNNKPLLVVCYTNHALDQFLEGIINFYIGDVLRLGGRSSSEIMKNYSIANKRETMRRNRSIPRAIYKERTKTRFRVKALRTSISLLAARIESAKMNILHEECLQAIISQKHFRNLISGYELVKLQDNTRDFWNAKKRTECALIEWLGYAQLLQQNTEERIPNTISKDRETTTEDDLVDVINEIDAETQQRQTDGYDDEENVNENEAIAEVTNSLSRLGIGENTVAINVSEMDDDDAFNPEMYNSNEWEIQGRQKRSMKNNLKQQLRLSDYMNDTEVSQIRDIWNLSSENKWRLYRYWIFQYCNIIQRIIDQNEEEFKNACKAHLEIQMQEDKDIMKHATVIGMTTTCAAKYQPVLKELGPRIIVVEEAAEVLEAHVITTLSKQCEHLILIGDHQQLKPNPTVYKLAQNFNLNLSLFERMIKNKLEYNCLQQQHRMRPEIAKIMKIIYPSLLNHAIVHSYEDIKGVSKNVFFVDHSEKESSEEESRSRSNKHEAEYIAGLCKYLLLQGYSSYQITVLTLYSGQLFCLKQKMPKSIFDGVKITVVDNFQGEENDIIILSLVRSNAKDNIGFLSIENRVCVALSRAKKGFYVIGNFEMLARKNQLWKSIINLAKDDEFISEGLTLYCQNHPNDKGIYARSGSDFQKAPEGGCIKPCDVRLRCGHTCTRACHVSDSKHEQFKCMKPCVKNACNLGHRCQGRCSQKCPPCMYLIDKTLPICGHIQNVPCSMDPLNWSCTDKCKKILKCNHLCGKLCGESHTDRCQVLVKKDWSCGHSATIECYMSNMQCPLICKSEIDCGHLCKGTCGQCFQGRLHKACTQRCNRTLLCEHPCKDFCSNCPPCTLKCENRCIHSNCQKICGEQCIQCIEKCEWQCPHFRCTKLCSQPCDRPRCYHRCSCLLRCGHRCIGVCGEPCLTLCKICNKDQITKIFSGLDDKPYALFVQLEDCSHVFEVDWLDKWMDNDSQTREKTPVKLKECPKCNKPIRRNVRYGNLIKQTLKDIETVKQKLEQRKSELEYSALRKSRSLVSADRRIFNELYSTNQISSQNSFAAIENQIRFLVTLSKIKEKYQNEVVKKRTGGIDLLNALKQIDELHDFIIKERSYFSIQETDDILREIERFNLLLNYSLLKEWKLKSDIKMDASFDVNLRNVKRYLTDGNPLIDRRKVFVTKFLKVVEDLIPRLGLGLSDRERTVLVNTKQLFKGYWYKCKNGHVYAAGDCGGEAEGSICPECKTTAGGRVHRLRERVETSL